jgi:hypothetical protein
MILPVNPVQRICVEICAVSASAPNITVPSDSQHGKAAWTENWVSNFKYCHALLAQVRPLA